MAVWTPGRRTHIVCPARLIVAFAFFLACSPREDSVRALVLTSCSFDGGDSNRTEVQCTLPFFRAENVVQGDVILVRFAFAIGDELEPILRCRADGENFTVGAPHKSTEDIHNTVVGGNKTGAFPNRSRCWRIINGANFTGRNTPITYTNVTYYRCNSKTTDCTVFCMNLTRISQVFKMNDVINIITISRNTSHIYPHGAQFHNETESTNYCDIYKNVTHDSLDECDVCKTIGAVNCPVITRNTTNLFPDGDANWSTVEMMKCIIECRNSTFMLVNETFYNTTIETDNCSIVSINETHVCESEVNSCGSSNKGYNTSADETRDGGDEGNVACEYKRSYGLRLASTKIEPAPKNYKVSNAAALSYELTNFLGKLENMYITFSPNCSKESAAKCSATGVLEISPGCNFTSWRPGCELKVFFNTSLMGLQSIPSLTYGWKGVIADLKLHGKVQSLSIAGRGPASVSVMDAIQELCLMGASTISLTYVHITDCSFFGVPLSGLQVLNISHSTLPDNCSFVGINADDLVVLILRNVSLPSVPHNLPRLTNLKILDLSLNKNMVSNDMASFQRELIAWTRLRNVVSLSLSGVHLGSLSVLRNLILEPDGSSCTPFSNLSELILSGCNIQNLEYEGFYRCFSNLDTLDLSYNGVSRLTSRIFYQLKNIKVLSLSNNKITILPRLEFDNETSLETFDLSYNGISTLSNFMTSGSTELLDLSYNRIVEWPSEEMFCKNGTFLTWVKKLNLGYNSLKTVTRVMGDSLLVLESVDLRGNKFDCSDCNTTEFQKWLTKTLFKFERVSIVRTDSKDVVCASPTALAGQKILNIKVNTTHCNISDKETFYLYVILPLISFLFVTVVLGSALAYKYRFELAYIRYYWSIKKRKHAPEITEDGEYEFDAFVSYSRHDRAWVLDELMEHLEADQEKYRLCLHERDFRLGSLILENIESSMRKSRFTLVILSKGFVDSQVTSQWCRWELEMANYKLFDDRREFLILLELEHLERKDIPRHLKYLIETRTYLEWPGPGRPSQQVIFWRRLRRALGESLHQRRQRLSSITTTITTTTTTVIAATTTTTIVTTASSCRCDTQTTPSHAVDKSPKVRALMPSIYSPTERTPYKSTVIAVPTVKLYEESEA